MARTFPTKNSFDQNFSTLKYNGKLKNSHMKDAKKIYFAFI